MKINPTKCVIVNGFGAQSGAVVYVTEIAPRKTSRSGVVCKVQLPSKAKKRKATWIDMGWLVAVRDEVRYGASSHFDQEEPVDAV